MSVPKSLTQSRIIQLVLILGLVAFILYIYLVVDIPTLITTLSRIKLEFYIAAFVAYIIYTFFSSLVWHRLLNNLAIPINRRKAFLFTWVGLFFDATVPQLGWSAEVSKTYMLTKDSNLDASKVSASVVGQKLFTNTMTVVALSLGLGLVLLNYPVDPLTALLIGLVLGLSILTLAVIYLVSIRQSATKTLLNLAVKIVLIFRKNWNPQAFKTKA
ncbi:MAG: lysylphosphatidylglycerol synthase transmembrane domain-containing protein, partial [Betaproteobacteria bacterium]